MTEETKTVDVVEGKKNITTDEKKVEAVDSIKFLQEQLADMQSKISLLEKVADPRKLALYHQREGKRGPSIVDVRAMDIEEDGKVKEKVIVGWRTVSNDVYLNPDTKREVVNQTIEIMYDDGKKEEMSLRNFVLRYKRISCKKMGEETMDGVEFPILRLVREDNGEEYRIGAQFVN